MRVLVIRAGQLGDTVCASSIIEPLRQQYGNNLIIHWVCKTGMASLFAKDHRVQRVYELRSRRAPLLINRAKLRIVFDSIAHPYDMVINLELGSMFNTVMRLIRAQQKIGMPFRHFAEPDETHAVTNLQLIYKSFIDNQFMGSSVPKLIGETETAIKDKFQLSSPYVVLVPSNSHNEGVKQINHRAWPTQHWQALFELLSQQSQLQIVIIGGKSEQHFFERLAPLPKNTVSLVGKTDLAQLTGVIANAAAMITTDTGPAHIAGAVNTPVVNLIGPTNHKRTAPYVTKDNQVIIVSANLDCSPCYHTERQAKCTDNKCMSEIIPSRVYTELLKIV